MPPLVTVLTTARNAERYVGEAIESIFAQTFSDWEYVIVDDASTDDTPAIIDRYARADPRIRVIRRDAQGGAYVAANQGFASARTRYVARLDADDVSRPHRLEAQLDFLSRNPELRACAADVLLLSDGQARPMGGHLPVLPGSLKWRLFFRTFLPSTTLVETSAWADVGGFRELPLSQDLRFWCDLARRRWLGAIPEPLVEWRVHDEQLSARRYDLQQALAIQVLKDHLDELGSPDWTDEDVDLLRWVGERPIGFRGGLRVLARWTDLWRQDQDLSPDERGELSELTRRLRVAHARALMRGALSSSGWGRFLLRTRLRVKKSFRPSSP